MHALRLPRLLPGALGLSAALACYGAGDAPPEGGATASADGGAPRAPAPSAPRGLPCDVDAVLEQRCRACHGAAQTDLPALTSHDEFMAPAPSQPEKRLAERVLERTAATEGRMPPPPRPPLTDEERGVLTAWGAAGFPRGACGDVAEDAGPSADADVPPRDAAPGDASTFDAASQCASGRFWSSTATGADMNPGRACIACHFENTGEPKLVAGGTVYAATREPDRCYGEAGVVVAIDDAEVRTLRLTTGPTGNFSVKVGAATIAAPYAVRILFDGREKASQTPHTLGDCNGCHTATGANGASGRLTLP